MITEVAIQIPDKIYFKSKTTVRDKEGHYILINGSIHQEVTNINILQQESESKYVKQILKELKEEKRQLCNNRRLNTLF